MPGSSKVFGCPHCGSTEGFTEADLVSASASILSFDETGEPVFGGESEVDWDSQALDTSESEPYGCDACGGSFAKPVPVSRKRRKRAA
jgi:hypothetical protein